ncbi:hypothetical protein VPH35_114143 [Triticum aestivum]
MDREGRSFEALVYGDPNPPPPCEYMDFIDRNRWVWHWRPLPLPPIVVDDRGGGSISVESYALLNGHGSNENASNSSSTIGVSFNNNSCREWSGHKSAPTGGTYCFNTGTGKWAKAGDWMLPFCHSFCLGTSASIGTYCFDTGNVKWAKAGDWALPLGSRALRFPELGYGLLFGVDNKHFLTMEVFGDVKTNKWAPVLRHAWVDVDVDDLLDWRLQNYGLTYLGDGRFCINRSFDVMETDGWGSGEERVDTVVLLTVVEVVRDGSGLQMIKHKSKRLDSSIYDVL